MSKVRREADAGVGLGSTLIGCRSDLMWPRNRRPRVDMIVGSTLETRSANVAEGVSVEHPACRILRNLSNPYL